jgi:hypothetical protein
MMEALVSAHHLNSEEEGASEEFLQKDAKNGLFSSVCSRYARRAQRAETPVFFCAQPSASHGCNLARNRAKRWAWKERVYNINHG